MQTLNTSLGKMSKLFQIKSFWHDKSLSGEDYEHAYRGKYVFTRVWGR